MLIMIIIWDFEGRLSTPPTKCITAFAY